MEMKSMELQSSPLFAAEGQLHSIIARNKPQWIDAFVKTCWTDKHFFNTKHLIKRDGSSCFYPFSLTSPERSLASVEVLLPLDALLGQGGQVFIRLFVCYFCRIKLKTTQLISIQFQGGLGYNPRKNHFNFSVVLDQGADQGFLYF